MKWYSIKEIKVNFHVRKLYERGKENSKNERRYETKGKKNLQKKKKNNER